MTIEVLTPEEKVFSGEASGVQMPGFSGSFEVLNNHAPLIAALKTGTVRIAGADSPTFINITGGFVEVLNNKVVILAEGVEKASEA